jgi:hypothetical protein
MGNQLEKWRKVNKSLVTGGAGSSERQRMEEALGRLQRAEWKRIVDRPSGRLIFGLDLTGSREPGLRHARIATAAMFDTIKAIGPVQVKLIYYRGIRECRAGAWNDPAVVSRSMVTLCCESGETQIARLLRAAFAEEKKISGVVFVGDHCEDNAAELRDLAQAFGERSIPLFMFHECDDDERSLEAKPIFKCMAEASGGVYVEFRPDSGVVLREMLSNVAALAAAGTEGVRQVPLPKTPEARQLRGRLLSLTSGKPEEAK